MRVIAGKAKGRKLQDVKGPGTRPITDRAKSALFSILSYDVQDSDIVGRDALLLAFFYELPIGFETDIQEGIASKD